MVRKFEGQYRISSIDEVLKKENAIHLDLDLRLDVLETKSDADKSTAEIIARGVSIIDNVLVPKATEVEELLENFRQGVPADKVMETTERRFLSDAEIADLQSRMTKDQVQAIADASAATAAASLKVDLVGGAGSGRNTLKKLSDAIDVLTAGAPAMLDSFIEIAAKLSAEDDQLAAIMSALASRVRTDAPQGLSPSEALRARSNIGAGRFESEAYFNLLMNPRFAIQQFNNGGIYNSTNGYIVDGWSLNSAGLNGYGDIRAPGFTTRPELTFGLFIGVTASKAALASTDALGVVNPVEGIRCKRLQWGTPQAKPALVAGMIRSIYAGTVSVSLRNAVANQSLVHDVTVAPGDNFFAFVAPPCPTGAWRSDFGVGLYFAIYTACGTAFITNTTDAWVAGNFVASPATSNLAASTNNGVTIADCVILPLSDVSVTAAAAIGVDRMPLFQRQDEDELALCMRHYETGNINIKGYVPGSGYGLSSTYNFKFIKRAAPSCTVSATGYSNTSGAFLDQSRAATVRGNVSSTTAAVVESDIGFIADARLY